MDLGLSGRCAVVTGGSSGIGLATAKILLAEGASVAICGRDRERLEHATAALAAKHGRDRIFAHACDVTSRTDVEAFAAALGRAFPRLDLLVNNAGQARISTFRDTTDEAWRAELELKFFSQIHTARAFEPLLRKSEAPAIIGVNSLLAYQPEPHMVCTSAARAGVQSLLKSLATELAPGIRVNSVVLGLIDSGQWQRRFETSAKPGETKEAWLGAIAKSKGIPLARLGQPDEVARAVVFLGSAAASYITGASLEVSGGVSRFI
jgi:NAD(P)-dependent dehydrogenase (short-subunit alcohol dehydrogenase family)